MKSIPRISEAEREVLGVLWRKAPITASEVFSELKHGKWKLNTVRTFLARLKKKGAIKAKEAAGGRQFAPALSRAQFVQAASQSFLNRVFEGATGALLIHFAKSKRLSTAELEELQSILDAKRQGK